jgi:hypothetical protein
MRMYMRHTGYSEGDGLVYGNTPPDEEDVVAEARRSTERVGASAREAMIDIPVEVIMALEGFNRVLNVGRRSMAAYAQA